MTTLVWSFGWINELTITLKRGKLQQEGSIELPNGREIQQLEENEDYKYLGVLEADDIKHKKMKVRSEKNT